MKFSSKRSLFTITAVCLTTIGLAISWPDVPRRSSIAPIGNVAFAQGAAQTTAKPQMSEVAFKNIQVLKGITVDEFMGTMGLFSAALSVCCGDCHTGAGGSNPNWADDPTRKRIARGMVQMMNKINADNFGKRHVVTCWTCHRGVSNPAVTPS